MSQSIPTRDDFASMLEESFSDGHSGEGQVVRGIVTAIEKDMAIIDVGLKVEGRVPLKEFGAKGKEGGQIEVGDTTGPPFSTNATGKVTNLDADKVDGKSSEEFASAGDLGFASVKADGTFVAGRGATASALTNPAENTYTVTFNKDVSKCSFTAGAVGASSDVGGFGATIGQQPTQVVVDEPNNAGGGAGRDFHLQVIC